MAIVARRSDGHREHRQLDSNRTLDRHCCRLLGTSTKRKNVATPVGGFELLSRGLIFLGAVTSTVTFFRYRSQAAFTFDPNVKLEQIVDRNFSEEVVDVDGKSFSSLSFPRCQVQVRRARRIRNDGLWL